MFCVHFSIRWFALVTDLIIFSYILAENTLIVLMHGQYLLQVMSFSLFLITGVIDFNLVKFSYVSL